MRKPIQKSATILLVDKIDPCLEFWTKTLGFEMTQSVPEGEAFGFVMLEQNGIELHLQTRSITKKDLPSLPMGRPVSAFLYFDVQDIDALEEQVLKRSDISVLVPKRKTFYGATELYVREPGGHMVGFAQVSS
jgi:uncharacterized glyoxalase superfamily protein PhnB